MAQKYSVTKPNRCCPEIDTAGRKMATKVLSCLICVFALLVLFSRECDANYVKPPKGSRPPGKILFQKKHSLPVSKVILKIIYP